LPTILIADDDPGLLDTVSLLLEASGYEVHIASSANETVVQWPRVHPDLVIVDLHMPGGGVDMIRRISLDTSIPVIVLSGDVQEHVKVAALDAGAEDYITKPFSAAELLARVRVALRRTSRDSLPITIGALTLSDSNLTASVGGAAVKLTPTEFDLMKAMALAGGFVATIDLLNEVWGPAYRTELEYVRVYIRRLRAKLDELGLPNFIESRPGVGYRLNVGEQQLA
jgi:two-component system KDP operon response regulator KdpE